MAGCKSRVERGLRDNYSRHPGAETLPWDASTTIARFCTPFPEFAILNFCGVERPRQRARCSVAALPEPHVSAIRFRPLTRF